MRRLVTAGLVVAAGYAAYRLARAYLPDDLQGELRAFGDTVREGMAQRELELREALGMDFPGGGADDGRPQGFARLDADSARALLDDPAGLHAAEGLRAPQGLRA